MIGNAFLERMDRDADDAHFELIRLGGGSWAS